MRVLAAGNMYPPHHFGGYELVWRSAMEFLRARGHAVRVLTTDLRTGASEPDDRDVRRELRWHWSPGGFSPQRLPQRVETARHNHRALRAHLDDFRPDVVSWWSMGGLSLTMIEAVRRRGLPAVAFVHDDWLAYGRDVDEWLGLFRGRGRRLAPLAERLSRMPSTVDFADAATWVFVSESTRRRAESLGLGLARTAVAHSGIDPAFLDPAPERPWEWRLLYVGRLDERKGVQTAIEALADLPGEARLRVAGGWDEREAERLRGLAATLGVAGRIDFRGQVDRRDLHEAYGWADAVVFPVIWEEPWGLVPLEAMARGTPVAATGMGGSAEYLRDGRNCVLFPPGDAQALAAALKHLADDDGLRTRLRSGGLATAELHTEDGFNERVEGFLLEASERVKPARPRTER